jgi:hypothetical protein
MPMSNYPNGFPAGVSIRGIPINQTHPGNVFWVSSTSGSDGNKGTFQKPFATIDYAIGRCSGSKGDIILVKPGHVENISAASFITADIAAVAIVGLGVGSAVPTLSWTATDATIVVSAANVSFVNMKFVNNVADVVTMFSVSGGGDGLTFEKCVFTDTSTVLNAIDFITLATGADDLAFIDCRVIGKSASNDSFITGVAHDRLYIADCQIQFDVAQTSVVGVIETSGNATNVWIRDSLFRSNVDGALFLDFNGGANSGGVTNCYFSSIDTAGATTAGFDFTGGHFFECYVAGEADTYGIIGGGSAYNDA